MTNSSSLACLSLEMSSVSFSVGVALKRNELLWRHYVYHLDFSFVNETKSNFRISSFFCIPVDGEPCVEVLILNISSAVFVKMKHGTCFLIHLGKTTLAEKLRRSSAWGNH